MFVDLKSIFPCILCIFYFYLIDLKSNLGTQGLPQNFDHIGSSRSNEYYNKHTYTLHRQDKYILSFFIL